MEEPKITWLVRRDDEEGFMKSPDFYAGTYNQKKELRLFLQIWNNRFGSETVHDLEDFGIRFSFDKEEDSVLLQYLSVYLGTTTYTPIVTGNGAVVKFPESVVLHGTANDGADTNTDNYVIAQVVIDVPENVNLKLNDLKTMTMSIAKL